MQAAFMAQRFQVAGRLVTVDASGGGNVNETYQAIFRTVYSEERFFLQRISPNVFREPEKVMEALKEIGNVPTILPEEGVFVGLQSYGDSAIKYVIRVWTDNDQYWPTMYAIHERIPGMLRQKGIEMTYPQLNVHIQQ